MFRFKYGVFAICKSNSSVVTLALHLRQKHTTRFVSLYSCQRMMLSSFASKPRGTRRRAAAVKHEQPAQTEDLDKNDSVNNAEQLNKAKDVDKIRNAGKHKETLETEQEDIDEIYSAFKQRPSETFRQKSEDNEFFGVPLSKRAPQTEAEVQAKLAMPFDDTNQLFQFYESNRDLFASTDTFSMFLKKAIHHSSKETKQGTNLETKQSKIKYRQRVFKDLVTKDIADKLFADKVASSTYPPSLFTLYFNAWTKFVDNKHVVPSSISNAFVASMEKAVISTIDETANDNHINCIKYLTGFKTFGIPFGQVCRLMYKLCDSIISQDKLKDLTLSNIYNILYVFGNVKMDTHTKFMYLVEPHVLKHIDSFKPDSLANIVICYSKMHIGSAELIRILFEQVVSYADKLSIDHIAKLLNAMIGEFFSKDVQIDGSNYVVPLVKAAMKQLDKVTPLQLNLLVSVLHRYKVTDKAYYELLAITFSKHYDQYKLYQKSSIIYKITTSKIDEASIYNRTQQTLREYLSMFLFNDDLNKHGEFDAVKLSLEGIFSKRQMVYLQEMQHKTAAEGDSKLLSTIGSDNTTDLAKVEQALKHFKSNIVSFAKILWCYLVFASIRIKSGDRQTIDYALVSSSVETINAMLSKIPADYSFVVHNEVRYIIEQINETLSLRVYDVAYKKRITLPSHTVFDESQQADN